MTVGRQRWVVVAFVLSAVFAGGNGIAVRFSNRELAPFWGAALRFVVAGLLLVALMALMRIPMPAGRALLGAALYGTFQFAGAFGFYYWALQEMQAGFGQVILALVPLATLLLAVVQGQDRLTTSAVVGTLLSLAGVAVVSSGPLRSAVPLTAVLAVLVSVVCFGQAAVVVRRFPAIHPVATNAVGMVVGGAILLATSVIFGERFSLPERPEVWVALVYVAVFGSIGAFLLYVIVIQRWGASRAAYMMVLVPLVTISLSAWLDAEPISVGLIGGALLVIAGVYIGALRPARAAAVSETAAPP